MSNKADLRAYLSKRDFSKTPEPDADDDADPSDLPMFVIQEHDASTHHYDFRLEIGGMLASWAVPKGPSTDPGARRLAVRTEDHPLAYRDFEGVIPEDEYGGGTVIVWDAGPYLNLQQSKDEPRDMRAALDAGHIEVFLRGQKLQGGYALIRTDKSRRRDDGRWLLVKMNDTHADARRNPTRTESYSVLSDRTLADVEDAEDAR